MSCVLHSALAMTEYATIEDRAHTREGGIPEHVAKPIDAPELIAEF